MTTLARPQQLPVKAGSDYATVLKSVQALGLMRRRYGFYLTKVALLLLAMGGVWVGFALVGHSWAQLGIAAGLAVVIVQVIFISHDAAHKEIFQSAKANEMLALILGTGIGGMSLAWWNIKHTRHHAAPNQIGRDPDIEPSIVHFYPAEKPIRSRLALAAHARQGWWFYPLLIVEALNLHMQSVVALITTPTMKRRKIELGLLAVRLGGLPAVLFVFLPPGLAGAFLGVQLAVTGVYLGASFAVSHIGMKIVAPTEKIGFLHRQVLSSRNIAGGRLASFAMGGLNYQIEHHLFPSMPRPNLRKARPIVQNYCRQNDIDYHEVPIHRAWAIVIKYLNKVGMAGRDAYGCPTASILR